MGWGDRVPAHDDAAPLDDVHLLAELVLLEDVVAGHHHERLQREADLGINPIVTLGKQVLNMIGNLV